MTDLKRKYLLKTEIVFDIGLQAYSVRQLSREDIGAIQKLFEKCLDYMLLIDGQAADPNKDLNLSARPSHGNSGAKLKR